MASCPSVCGSGRESLEDENVQPDDLFDGVLPLHYSTSFSDTLVTACVSTGKVLELKVSEGVGSSIARQRGKVPRQSVKKISYTTLLKSDGMR